MSLKLRSVYKTNEIWMPWQRSLMDQKINFRLIIYGHSSTNPEYLAMIGRMHLGLTNIIKK